LLANKKLNSGRKHFRFASTTIQVNALMQLIDSALL